MEAESPPGAWEDGKTVGPNDLAKRFNLNIFPQYHKEDERYYQPAINALCRSCLLSLVNMSLWGTLTGQKQPSSSTPSSSSRDPSTSSPPSSQSTTFDPNSAADVSSFLGDAALPDPSQLHPLAGLNRQTLDYLSLEESALSGKCAPSPSLLRTHSYTDLPGAQSALPSRGWTDGNLHGLHDMRPRC